MDNDDTLQKLQGYLTLEQKFSHQRLRNQAETLSKSEVLELLEIAHTNYLIKNHMFKVLKLMVKDVLPPVFPLACETGRTRSSPRVVEPTVARMRGSQSLKISNVYR